MSSLSPLNALVVRASLPVMFGYLPLGAAFGVLFSELGYHWLWASAMGLFIYAGPGHSWPSAYWPTPPP